MGGMGPDATVDFMAKVIALTDSGRDQDHVHMIIDHDPSIPNRQAAINSGNDDVSARLAEMAQRLESAGADFLVMVCNTAHFFLEAVNSSTSIPFISIIDESVNEIDSICADARIVGAADLVAGLAERPPDRRPLDSAIAHRSHSPPIMLMKSKVGIRSASSAPRSMSGIGATLMKLGGRQRTFQGTAEPSETR